MAWREKVAWLSLSLMLATYGAYFTLVARGERGVVAGLMLFGICAGVHAIGMIAGSAVLAATSGQDRRGGADERDRAIEQRGTRIAYFVLLSGMIVVGVVMPFGAGGWKITNAALLAVVVAEAVRHAVVVAGYRGGWLG